MGSPFLSFFVIYSLQLWWVVNGRKFSDHHITPIRLDLYRSSDNLIKDVKALVDRHPDVFTMETMRAVDNDYSAAISVITYNNPKRGLDEKLKSRILISFGQHGRELITSEVALHLLSVISKEKMLPNMDLSSLDKTLENLVIKVVPMENLNGRRLVEAGDPCERRNGRAVDLNRNWSVDWGKKEQDFDPYEENPGTAPFSEPETQIMQKLSTSFNPHIWVNVHSGMEAMFMPYDHRNATPNGSAFNAMKSILEDLNHHHCRGRCLVGSGGGSVGYLAHGTSTDYMYDALKVPMAFTFEIYGDLEAPSRDCFRMFNPINLATFNRVLNDWSAAFISLFERGPLLLDRTSDWVPIDSYKELMGRKEVKGVEMIDLGMQEIRTYFRLFLLSSVLLMFMFCSRISKSKCIPSLSSIPL
ncbi:hypothetical protein QJS04_geneDACA001360 [Acorus gramineus]|uniref:Peptidase M14 domain-containing protein n=1 Tax=Acorus gramineus TaxID=55184 RepID=A0AAV9ADZ9_ACOGR|nr:hypothetical protein QJS04_geneDACA001360 [Acorus gramineus]